MVKTESYNLDPEENDNIFIVFKNKRVKKKYRKYAKNFGGLKEGSSSNVIDF